MPARTADGRVVTFQNDISLQSLSQFAGLDEPFVAVGRMSVQTVEFLGMWRHDDALRQLLQPGTMVGQDVQRVSIGHNRALRTAQLGNQCNSRLLTLSQSGTNTQGIEVFRIDGFGKHGFFIPFLNDSLRDRHLQNGDVALGRIDVDLAGTSPQTGSSGQYSSSCHAITASYEQGVAHLALMGKRTAAEHQLAYVVFFDDGVGCFNLRHSLLTQTDVEHTEVAHKLLVLSEEERQLELLKGQRVSGADDVGTHVVRVVLRHQTRGYVNGHHLGRRGVDILDQRGKTASQRLVESGTKESVDNQHIGFKDWRIELLNDLDELLDAFVLLNTLLVGSTVG